MVSPLILNFEQRVQAPPDRVWAVLGDFGHEDRWARLLRRTRRDRPDVEVGTIRHCELATPMLGRDTLREELIELRPGEGLAYRLLGGLGPFASVENRWRIRPAGDETLVETEARLVPRSALVGWLLGPLVRAYLRFALRGALGEFAAYVESTGKEVRA